MRNNTNKTNWWLNGLMVYCSSCKTWKPHNIILYKWIAACSLCWSYNWILLKNAVNISQNKIVHNLNKNESS